MMPVAISILSGTILVIVLFRVWRSTCLPGVDLPYDPDVAGEEWASCPKEFVDAIFGSDDWEFVSKLGSVPLKMLFRKERKSVARDWVRVTAGSIQRIMREHLQISRRSSDLDAGVELKTYLTYIVLQTACALLLLSIGLIGPVRLRSVSVFVYSFVERLTYAHVALKAATELKESQGVSHA